MEKYLISGTGRCGTTFLIKLFSFLDYDTGFNMEDYNNYIFKNCNSGMERDYNEKYYILKNPNFIANIDKIINDHSIKIKSIIFPIRNLKESAQSREKNNFKAGGLWNAASIHEQLNYYNSIISNYIVIMTKYEIDTIFIDFDKMITDKKYLYNKLKNILNEKYIDFEYFSNIYDKASLTSRPQNTNENDI